MEDSVYQFIGLITDETVSGNYLPDHSIYEEGKNVVVYNLNLEAGVQYKKEFFKRVTVAFDLGYKMDGHFESYYNKSVSLRREAGPNSELTNRKYGSEDSDFINHGPFLRTSINF